MQHVLNRKKWRNHLYIQCMLPLPWRAKLSSDASSFSLIILEMFLQLHGGPLGVNWVDIIWKATHCLHNVPQLTLHVRTQTKHVIKEIVYTSSSTGMSRGINTGGYRNCFAVWRSRWEHWPALSIARQPPRFFLSGWESKLTNWGRRATLRWPKNPMVTLSKLQHSSVESLPEGQPSHAAIHQSSQYGRVAW